MAYVLINSVPIILPPLKLYKAKVAEQTVTNYYTIIH